MATQNYSSSPPRLGRTTVGGVRNSMPRLPRAERVTRGRTPGASRVGASSSTLSAPRLPSVGISGSPRGTSPRGLINRR